MYVVRRAKGGKGPIGIFFDHPRLGMMHQICNLNKQGIVSGVNIEKSRDKRGPI